MTRVNINGAGHQVEVQHDGGDLAYVIEKAQKLWDDTKPPDGRVGPGGAGQMIGFAAQPREWADLRDGERPVVR
jgi:hypothetical protein